MPAISGRKRVVQSPGNGLEYTFQSIVETVKIECKRVEEVGLLIWKTACSFPRGLCKTDDPFDVVQFGFDELMKIQ